MLLLAAILTASSCTKKQQPDPQQPPSRNHDKASQIYMERCANCHGTNGRGDGPVAGSLNPKPRDYSDAAWQRSVTDQEIAEIIVRGGGAMKKSAVMPAAPDLSNDPAVLKALVQKIRSFEN